MDFSYIPALVQVQEPWQKMYLGCCAGKGTSVSLDMVHLKKVPSHCRYLTGMHFFKFNLEIIYLCNFCKKIKIFYIYYLQVYLLFSNRKSGRIAE